MPAVKERFRRCSTLFLPRYKVIRAPRIFGPSTDTGGLPQNSALTIYTYPDMKSFIEGESKGGIKAPLPGPGNKPSYTAF